jgi:hypothetical protein
MPAGGVAQHLELSQYPQYVAVTTNAWLLASHDLQTASE